MEQKKNNQERGRKYGGSSSYVDIGEPSKAPRQDEYGKEFIGPSDSTQPPEYSTGAKQGVSNRPAKVEHPFPESPDLAPDVDAPDSVEATPKQQGGNRGGV